MNVRFLALGALASLASAISLQAQCGEAQFGTPMGSGDDIIFPMQSLGFAFPFNGTTYTDITVTTNGLIYLSNAGVPAAGGSGCCAGSTATLVAGGPTIAPYWTDMNAVAGVGDVLFNNTLPGKAVITWRNVYEYSGTVPRTFQCQLWVTGEIDFSYDARNANATHTVVIGMSQGGGAALPAASDFSVVGVSGTTTNFQLFDTAGLTYDLAGQTVQFVPTVPGYAWIPTVCPTGSNVSYGRGCYNISDSVYSLNSPPAVASAALSGTAITFLPAGSGYVVTNGGAYVAPTGAATALTLTDDSSVLTPTLTTPFPYPGGSAAALSVGSNGWVAVAAGNSTAYTPDVPTMLNTNLQTAWYSWHDYNPAAVGGGQVKFEQVGSITYITWDGVYSYSGTTAAAANFMQFQFDSANGTVTIAWQSLSTISHSLPLGEPHLVGYSPGGAGSLDTGSVTLATDLPIVTSASQLNGLALSAAPTPVSSPGFGGPVNFTLTNIPEFVPTSGIYVGLHIFSLGQLPAPGLDLGFLGMPSCKLLISTLDVILSQVTLSPSQVTTFTLPPGLPAGLQFFSQGAAMFTPGSLPNGQNAFGAVTSNAIASTVGTW